MGAYRETDYLYASARIRAKEAGLVGKEKLEGLLSLRDADAIAEALITLGFPRVERADGALDTEGMCRAALKEGFDTVAESLPHAAVLDVLRIPYDCNNIKALLKSSARGVDATGLLSPLGAIPPHVLQKALEAGQVPEGLSPHLAAAAEAAREVLERTGDPQEAEMLLDRAAFEDMHARAADMPFVRGAVELRADLVNLMTCMRLARIPNEGLREALLPRALVPHGTLDGAVLSPLLEGEEGARREVLKLTPYAGIFAGSATDLALLSRRADEMYMEYVRGARSIPFGAPVVFGYLTGLEYSVKNLRILLAGRRAGVPVDEIRKSWRGSYV